MSQREPDGPTIFNDSNNIERQMQEDGHEIWGWVIYRSEYSSEGDWQEFLSRLRTCIEKSLGRQGGLDMLPKLNYHVFEDRELFDGVDAATIREHFRVWVVTASQQEQGGAGLAHSQRYQFCVQVDADACIRLFMKLRRPLERMRRVRAGSSSFGRIGYQQPTM
ncbi:hypothetical protein LTR17_025000 [Elasticomyces elasticus]|nr:hypothetical protein LTR17_025000 [Elasticomyces elasticus]